MRLWSLHPKYLDASGLTACWREALLARAVLSGSAKGYVLHPQLRRFRDTDDPVAAVNAYLYGLFEEASKRGFRFDSNKLVPVSGAIRIPVAEGQLAYEFAHLKRKLERRSPQYYARLVTTERAESHPLFYVEPGGVADWEKIKK